MDLSKVKVLEEFKGTDNLEFRVVEWDATLLEDLKVFCETCKQQGMKNNESTKALKFGKWGDQENWWFVYHGDKIISMSGAHYLPHIHKDCYFNLQIILMYTYMFKYKKINLMCILN